MGQELTKSDVEKIQAEIDHRKLVLRPQITREIAEAAAQGDRSENFEYYAAKKANRENNGRINYLERVLRFARIIDDSSKDDEVGLNNTVTLYFEEDDEEETYRIVTSIRGNSIHGLISNESFRKLFIVLPGFCLIRVVFDDDELEVFIVSGTQ